MKSGDNHFRVWLQSFVLLLAMLTALTLQACYSSVAVKGTPVKDVAPTMAQLKARKAVDKEKKETLARLSSIKENKVFKEIEGVPEYRVGPLDVLEISSHVGDKVNTETVTVNSRGKISFSFVDNLGVAGLTPSEIDDALTKSLAQYIRNPRINILVKEFNSKSAMVMGELASLRSGTYGQAMSGKIQLKGKTTIIDLISQAGGYTEDGDIKNTKLTRRGKTYTINLYDIIEKGDASLDVIIDAGDVVDIPELPAYADQRGGRVYIMGEVNNQGIYPLRDAQDLLSALSLAGSYTQLAKEENTLVVRGYEPGQKPEVLMADVKALLRKADLSQNVTLKNGDLVYVPRMLIGDINEWISNTTPLLDFLFYPEKFESAYSLRKYLHVDRLHHD